MVRNKKSAIKIFRNIIPLLIGTIVILIPIIFLLNKNTKNKVVQPTQLKFDEGYGTTIGASNDTTVGTIAGGTWIAEELCLSGKCLFFNGNNTSINLGDDNDFDFTGTTSFTIGLWFRHGPISSGTQVLVAKANSSAGYKIQMESDGDLTFAIDDDASSFPDDTISSTAATYDDNRWHHLSAVKTTDTKIELFIDGVLVASKTGLTGTGDLVNSANLYIGVDGNGSSNFYQGYIDEVNIYPTEARTSTTVKSDAIRGAADSGSSVIFGENHSYLSDGLVGYWKMDENSDGSSAVTRWDVSGNNNNLTDNSPYAASTVGKYGNAIALVSANSEYLSITDANQKGLDLSSAFTYSAWVKLTSLQTNAPLVRKGADDGTLAYAIGENSSTGNRLEICLDDDGYTPCDVSIATNSTYFTTGSWIFVTVTYDGTTVRAYKNGVEEIRAGNFPYTTSVIPGNFAGALRMGYDSNASSYLNGNLEEVRIYNRALSQNEITSLYRDYAPGPTSYYPMESIVGVDIFDVSGNGYTLTNGGGIHLSSGLGKFGKALYTGGTDETGLIAAYAGVPLNSGDSVTLEGWVYYTGRTNVWDAGTLFGRYNCCGASSYKLELTSGDDYLRFVLIDDTGSGNDTYTITNATAFPKNTWTHVSGVLNRNSESDTKLYINGIEQTVTRSGTFSSIGSFSDETYFNIGSQYYPVVGRFDDIKVYKYARTPSQVIQDMNGGHPTPGSPVGSAIAHWKFDEGYGDTAHNFGFVGSVLDGNLGGPTTCPQASNSACPSWNDSGKFGKTLTFSSTPTSDFIQIDYNSNINPGSGSWTISAWANPANSNQIGTIISVGDALVNYNKWGMFICGSANCGSSGQKLVLSYMDEVGVSERSFVSTADVADGNWHHYLFSINATTGVITAYVDGIAISGTSTTVGSWPGFSILNENMYIGANEYDGATQDYFNGSIDELKIYNIALTSDQVKAEYNQGKATSFGSMNVDSTGAPNNATSSEYCIPGDTSACNPPIGEWRLDEGAGATINDTSSNGFSGSLTDPPIWSTGKIGSSLNFNGTSNYVTIPVTDGSLLDLGAVGDSYTVTAWIYVDSDTDGHIISKGLEGWGSGQAPFMLDYNALYNTFGFKISDGSNTAVAYTTSGDIQTGRWYYVTGVRNITTDLVYVYVNGELIDTSTDTTTLSLKRSEDIIIGKQGVGSGSYFDGKVDNVKIYNYARTPAQIAWDYNKGAPIVQYKFDECTGSTAYDSALKPDKNTVSLYNGTINYGDNTGNNDSTGDCSTPESNPTNSMWYAGASGKYNGSLSFDGTNDYVVISDGANLDLNLKQITIAFWAKVTTPTSYDWLLAKSTNTSSPLSYGFLFNSTAPPNPKLTFSVRSNVTGVNLVTDTAFPVNTWTHVVGTWDGTTVKMYVDGLLQTQTASLSGTNINDTANDLVIGGPSNLTASSLVTGQLDEVRIYNYALTPVQIKTLYNNNSSVQFTQ